MVEDLEVFAQAHLEDRERQICSVEAETVVVVEIDSWKVVVASPGMDLAYSICLMMDVWAGDLEVGQDRGLQLQVKQAWMPP